MVCNKEERLLETLIPGLEPFGILPTSPSPSHKFLNILIFLEIAVKNNAVDIFRGTWDFNVESMNDVSASDFLNFVYLLSN